MHKFFKDDTSKSNAIDLEDIKDCVEASKKFAARVVSSFSTAYHRLFFTVQKTITPSSWEAKRGWEPAEETNDDNSYDDSSSDSLSR